MTAKLRLRPLRSSDEQAARAAHDALGAEGFPFLLDYTPGEPWDDYVSRREQNSRGERLPERWVRSSFLAATVAQELVGRASIRHTLSPWLESYGGHIGYAVVPGRRGRGHAKEILRQSLVIARSVGVQDVLIFCAVENIASARVIEACGGEFEAVTPGPEPGTRQRRYWIR